MGRTGLAFGFAIGRAGFPGCAKAKIDIEKREAAASDNFIDEKLCAVERGCATEEAGSAREIHSALPLLVTTIRFGACEFHHGEARSHRSCARGSSCSFFLLPAQK
jgi:hypothetical protein